MSEFFLAETTDTLVPLELTIDQEGVGGVTGQSPTVALRDASTTDSYLDFDDDTFKTAAWGTKYASMAEVERGHYVRIFDAAAATVAAGTVLSAEYRVDSGSIVGDDHDLIRFVASIDDIPGDVGGGGGSGGTILVNGILLQFLDFADTVSLPSSGSQVQRLVALDAETEAFGKVYISTTLSNVYVKFGDATVDATTDPIDSIHLVGGAPWTVATLGFSHMSIAATVDADVDVRGLRSR